MCGFFYTNDKHGFDTVKKSSQLTAKISIRGPDSTEFERDYTEHYHIMFSRLALSGRPEYGVQPKIFFANNRKLILLFNGEIFNFSNLAQEYNIKLLSGFGDTEILVRLLQIIPIEEVFSQLKGMYSICIVDPACDTIYLSRDYFGKLPLYYSIGNNGRIAVASVPSLAAICVGNNLLNKKSIISYFVSGYVEPGQSIFKGVDAVMPNEFLILKKGIVHARRELTRSFGGDNIDLKLATELSVKQRVQTSRKLSVFYSHGMDSSIIKKVVEDSITEKLPSYTAYFEDNYANDGYFISVNDYREETKKITQLIDDPIFDPATTVLSLLCKRMNDDEKVIFSGDGADEFDGGYTWYVRFKFLKVLRLFPAWKLFSPFLPSRLFDLLICPDNQLCQILRAQVSASLFNDLRKYLNCNHPLNKEIQNLRDYDISVFLPQTMLRKNDIAGSVNGKEIRTPFLDEDLFTKFYSEKLGKLQIKKFYKDLFDLKPRRKKGFDLPLGRWSFCTNDDLHDFYRLWGDLISEDLYPCKLIINSFNSNNAGKYLDLKIYQMVNWLKEWEKLRE